MFRTALIGMVLLSLTACSGTWRTYKDMISYALTEVPDITFTLDEIRQSPYDLTYIRLDERPQAALFLAFSQNNLQRWRSSDQAVFTLLHGRLIKTYGLPNDLIYSEAQTADPLQSHYLQTNTLHRLTDWKLNNESGYPERFDFHSSESDSIELEGQRLMVRKVSEQVTYADGSTAINKFWFSLERPVLLKSEQQLAAFGPRITLTHVSRIARLLPQH